MIANISSEDAKKLKRVIDEGLSIKQQVKDLNDGLREVVNAVATELNLKPAEVNKAIRIAAKQNLEDEKEKISNVEEILATVGRA